MGDSSYNNGVNNGGGISGDEKQFLEDLERAKRLSLECYETEQIERRNKYGGRKVDSSSPASTLATTTTNGRRLSQPQPELSTSTFHKNRLISLPF